MFASGQDGDNFGCTHNVKVPLSSLTKVTEVFTHSVFGTRAGSFSVSIGATLGRTHSWPYSAFERPETPAITSVGDVTVFADKRAATRWTPPTPGRLNSGKRITRGWCATAFSKTLSMASPSR